MFGGTPGNRTPICGFGDRCNAIIPETQILVGRDGFEPPTFTV